MSSAGQVSTKDGQKHPGVQRSRSSTGCQICKARRLKCDETRPTCLRCLKGKRQCSYAVGEYVESSEKFVMYTIPRALASTPDLIDKEKRALHYFRCRVAFEMAAPYTSKLWTELVFRLAEEHDFLMFALTAMSGMHESYSPRVASPKELEFDAIRHYNKAISRISQCNPTEVSLDALLVAIVVFHSFESLRGRFQRALQHVHSGLQIINERLSIEDLLYSSGAQRAIGDAFLALQNQAREYGNPKTAAPFNPLRGFQPPYVAQFTSWSDAHDEFEVIYNQIYGLFNHCQTISQSGTDLQAVFETEIRPLHIAVSDRFAKWKQDMEALETSVDDAEVPARLMLRSAEALFTAIFDEFPALSCFDTYNADIVRALELAERFLSREKTDLRGRRAFSLSPGIVPVLFMITWRAKAQAIRDWSLNLLNRADRREGVWDSRLAYQIGLSAIRFKTQLGAYESTPAAHVQISELTFESETTCRVTYIVVGDLTNLPGEMMPFEGAAGEVRYEERITLPPE